MTCHQDQLLDLDHDLDLDLDQDHKTQPPHLSFSTALPAPPPAGPSPPTKLYPHIRSCLSCRHRKVKCDRQHPCYNCDRAGNACVFPPGPGRAPKKPRVSRDPQLLDRLWKLEGIVRRLGTEPDLEDVDLKQSGSRNSSNRSLQRDGKTIDQEVGRLLIDEKRSCYVSNRLWASLGDEIEELRELIERPTPNHDQYSFTESSYLEQPHLGLGASIFGYRALAHSLRDFHPGSSAHLICLFGTFKTNVAPLVRIFHVPTVTDLFWEAIASLDLLDKVTETLLFTIYYAAVISLTPEECRSKLGDERTSLLARYRFAVEQALARANLLNTQSVMLIQASVLFLSALRNEDDSRVVWSMTALVFHLAQVMGLHRDGTVFGLKPFETEIRRRIWWHICLLDARSSEDHGCELIVHDAVFDTQMPSNINDSDLSRGMTELPKEREEATEMTFCLMRCHVTRSMRRIGYVPPSMRGADRAPDKPSPETRAALMMDLRNTLDERYIRYCDESIPFFLASATVGRLICARMFVAVHHPNSHKEPISSNTRDQLFSSSIEVIQFSNQLLTDPTLVQWNWYFKTHIQWHTVAFVLSEICARPPSAECDRAWNLVTTMYDRWEPKEQERNAHLGRPLGRLMERTRRTRENQRASASVLAGKWDPNQPNLRGAADPSCATSGSLLATAGDGLIPSGMDHLPRDPFFEGFDPFLWGPVAPMALESTNNFNPLAFDPAAFPAVPSGADNLC